MANIKIIKNDNTIVETGGIIYSESRDLSFKVIEYKSETLILNLKTNNIIKTDDKDLKHICDLITLTSGLKTNNKIDWAYIKPDGYEETISILN